MSIKIIILSLIFFTIFELNNATPTQSSKVGEPSKCSICLQQLSIPRENNKNKNVTILKCNHAFHTKCIQKWIKRSKTCPPCRAEVLEGQVFLINSKQKQEHQQQSAQPSTSRRQIEQMNSGPTRQPPAAVQRVNSFGQIRQNNSNPSNSLQQRPVIQRTSSGLAGQISLNTPQQRSDNRANASNSITRTNSDLPQRPSQNPSAGQVRQNSARQQAKRVAQSNTANTNTRNSMVRRNHNQQWPASTSNINELNSSQVVRRNPNQQWPASTSNINELNSSHQSHSAHSNAAELDRLLALQLHIKMKQQMRLRDEGFARRTQEQEDQAAELHSLEVARAIQEEEYERGIMNSSPEDEHRTGSQNSSESLESISTEQNDDDCAICLSSLSDGNEKGSVKTAIPCNHLFHRDCINVWLNTRKNCPICRAPVSAVNDVGQSSQGGASRNDGQSIQFPDESTLPDQLYGVASAFSQGISSFVNWLLESNTNELPHYYEQIALLQSATIQTKLLMEEENGQMKIVMIVDIDLNANHQQYLTVIEPNQEIHTLYIGRNGQNRMTFRDNDRRLNISRIIAIMPDDN